MNQALLDRVLQSPRLPSLPTIALEVIELVQQKDVNIKQIANTISHDPALTTKILKTVNSSFYGQAHQISTISHALVVLGLNSVKTLALGFSLVPNLKDSGGEGFDHVAFWKRSLYSASAARTLSRHCGLVQQEESFLGGLLQDLGMLAMNQTLGQMYRAIVAEGAGDHQRVLATCREKLGTDHAEVGGMLAEKWNLPPVLAIPIRYHEDPLNAPEELASLVRCIHLGSRIADVFVSSNPGQALETYYKLALEWFELSQEQAEPLLSKVHNDTVEMKRLFELPTGPLENPDEILARANEALLQLSLQTQQKSTQLEEENRQLVEKASTDSLTGAANRRKFNEFVSQQFTDLIQVHLQLSLLFLDVDHFKKFNDTYGHPTGDRVLIEVAKVLKEAMPKNALVARYGGEEFAVVLPKVQRLDAAKIGEAARLAIAGAVVESDEGQELHVTASIGVATHDGTVFTRWEQLVKAADQAVYASKHAGRNAVRVFSPRPKAQVPQTPAA